MFDNLRKLHREDDHDCRPRNYTVEFGEKVRFLKPSPDQIGQYVEISSAILAFLVTVFHVLRDYRQKTKTDPLTILTRAAGMAILPQAMIIMAGTFDPTLLCTVQGLRVFFMLGGLALLYICVRSVTS